MLRPNYRFLVQPVVFHNDALSRGRFEWSSAKMKNFGVHFYVRSTGFSGGSDALSAFAIGKLLAPKFFMIENGPACDIMSLRVGSS